MDRVDGETIPRKILRDDAYADARPRLAAQCGEIAARIHSIDPYSLPELPVLGAAAQIDQYRALLDGFGEPHPAFELGLKWLEDRAPAPPAQPSVVHGDFRNGNFIVGPEGIRAVLDWELAHLGDPIEDLGWLCVKSWRFGVPSKLVGGFGEVADLSGRVRTSGRRTGRRRRTALLGRSRHVEVGRHLCRPGLHAPQWPRAIGRARDARAPSGRDGMGPARHHRRRLVTMAQDRPTAAELVASGARIPRTRRHGRHRGPRPVPHPSGGQRARNDRTRTHGRTCLRGLRTRTRRRAARPRRRPPRARARARGPHSRRLARRPSRCRARRTCAPRYGRSSSSRTRATCPPIARPSLRPGCASRPGTSTR